MLSEYNHCQLLVPKRFAHGFVTLTPNYNVQYKVDEYYLKKHDGGIAFDDKSIGTEWPMPLDKMVLSDKKTKYPIIVEFNNPFIWEGLKNEFISNRRSRFCWKRFCPLYS